jgi:hypothetical protein
MDGVDGRSASLGTLGLLLAGVADDINTALAVALLNVEYLDAVIDELAVAAQRPRTAADTAIADVIAAITRIRDVVRELDVLTGDGDGDAAETIANVLGVLRTGLGDHVEVIDGVRGPAPTRVSRRLLASVIALALGEIHRTLDGAPSVVNVDLARADGHVTIGLTAALGDGASTPGRSLGSWGAVERLLADAGGTLALDRTTDGFRVELRVPGQR